MNQHLLDEYNATLDGDEWGNCQEWRFATAHVLYHMDEVPEEWDYHHGGCYGWGADSESFPESEIIFYYQDGLVGAQDLIEFGNMLNNLRDILVSESKDY